MSQKELFYVRAGMEIHPPKGLVIKTPWDSITVVHAQDFFTPILNSTHPKPTLLEFRIGEESATEGEDPFLLEFSLQHSIAPPLNVLHIDVYFGEVLADQDIEQIIKVYYQQYKQWRQTEIGGRLDQFMRFNIRNPLPRPKRFTTSLSFSPAA